MSKRNIELTDIEHSIIMDALNSYWNEASEKLSNNNVVMSGGVKRPLGDIEKRLLKQQKDLTAPILRRFEKI